MDLEIAPPPFCRHAPKERKRPIFQTQRAKRTRFFPMSNTPCGTRARNLRIRGPTPCPLGQGGSAHLAQLFALPPFRYARAGAPPAVFLPRRSMATSAHLKMMKDFVVPRKANGPARAFTTDFPAFSRMP